MKKHCFPVLTLLLASLVLAACGRSTPTDYYMLESVTDAGLSDDLPRQTLRVGKVQMAGYLERNDIVSRDGNSNRLDVARFHSWAEPLADGVARLTLEVLTAPMLAQGFNVLPPASDNSGDYTLRTNISRLDGQLGGKAVLQARWSLEDSRGHVIKRGLYSHEETTTASDYAALVAAQSRLIRGMAEHLAHVLPQYMRHGHEGEQS